jgi:hypothetical protein
VFVDIREIRNKFSNYGISLYKADNGITKWDKLEIDTTNLSIPTVKPTPCKLNYL